MKTAILISAYKDFSKIKILVDFLCDDNTIILIHINKLAPLQLHNCVAKFAETKTNVYIINPIIVRWSHISHVLQKIEAMKFLYNKKMDFDYMVCLTESDVPIKTKAFMRAFFSKNKDTSFFFDYEEESKKINFVFRTLSKDKQLVIDGGMKMKTYILKCIRILFEEIYLSEYSLTHEWKWYLYKRNVTESKKNFFWKFSIRCFFWFLVAFSFVSIFKFIINPCEKKYIAAQRFYFGKKINKKVDLQMFSEWQFSITSFFSRKYVLFIIDNYDKYIPDFAKLYAPDETFWITIAKNFKSEVGEIKDDWKPFLLSIGGLSYRDSQSEPKLSWNSKNIDCLHKNSLTDECFARRVDYATTMKTIIDNLK